MVTPSSLYPPWLRLGRWTASHAYHHTTMIDNDTLIATIAGLHLMNAELARLYYELAEVVARTAGVSESDKANLRVGIEKSKQTMQKHLAFAADLQR